MNPQPPGDDVIRVAGTDREFHRRKILFVLLCSLALTLMAISSINVALPSIETSIGASNSDVQLLLSGYALAFGIVLVASGRIGDVLGRSASFVVGIALFTLGSLGAAVTQDPLWLNILRVLQGIGAGVCSPQVNGMILQYFTGRDRARAFALFGLVVSVAVAIAPSLTGLLINMFGPNIGWRASFMWNVPIGLLTIVAALRWLPFETERERRRAKQAGELEYRRLDLDPVGGVLLSLAVLCIMMPFVLKQPIWFLLLGVGALLIAAWLWWERAYQDTGREPMVDLGLFQFRSFTNAILVSGTMFLGATSIFAVLALYLQNGLGAPALIVGLVGLPNALASAWSSMWTGERVLNSGRRIIVGAFLVYLVGIGGCLAMTPFLDDFGPRLHYLWLALPLALCGVAIGAITSANQTLSQVDIPPRVGGTAGAVKQVAERIGTAIGNAMITAVLFAFATNDWTQGFFAAYLLIAAILAIAMVFAIVDLRMLGDGGSRQSTVAP